MDQERVAVSINDASQMLGIKRDLLYRLVRAGDLPSITIGTRRVIPTSAIRRFVEERAGEQAEAPVAAR